MSDLHRGCSGPQTSRNHKIPRARVRNKQSLRAEGIRGKISLFQSHSGQKKNQAENRAGEKRKGRETSPRHPGISNKRKRRLSLADRLFRYLTPAGGKNQIAHDHDHRIESVAPEKSRLDLPEGIS